MARSRSSASRQAKTPARSSSPDPAQSKNTAKSGPRSRSLSLAIPADATPSCETVLSVLPRNRIVDLGREAGFAIPTTIKKELQIRRLLQNSQVNLAEVLGWLGRGELKRACVAHDLDPSGHDRLELATRLLQASGHNSPLKLQPLFKSHQAPRAIPRAQDIVEVRHRQYLVESVKARDPQSQDPNPTTLIELVCLDDDHQGARLEVLWELEKSARILNAGQDALQRSGLAKTIKTQDLPSAAPEVEESTEGHGDAQLDHPDTFFAYLRAMQWNAVTATDAKLFQSPFRAGISVMRHQLTPLMKALSLPRANLLIADDVGLGKTIEAGLVMSELELRQRVDFSLIVCPASICLQWRDEMRLRFGLDFAIFHRGFLAQRQRERGFGVNAWSTHNRFIVSYHTLARPEYLNPLLARIGPKLRKSMLILDEAHTVAPASASAYAVDSGLTKTIRELAPRFENRIFLSATPHNGHSNSFSALLEMLDHQRFTRGIPVQDPRALAPVMVRRLKKDLQHIGAGFPTRRLVQVELSHQDGAWTAISSQEGTAPGQKKAPRRIEIDRFDLGTDPGKDPAPELQLSELLAAYAKLAAPTKSAARLVFVQLQKRLLSSIEAFARTLALHRKRILRDDKRRDQAASLSAKALRRAAKEDSLYGIDDETQSQLDEAETLAGTALLESLSEEARALLEQMTEICERTRHQADAKTRALLAWIKSYQCPKLSGDGKNKRSTKWNDTRVIIFTEYGDTKKYLKRVLNQAIEGSDRAEERIAVFSGGMSDENRAKLQKAFTSDPKQNPVRILIATDAAREGLNLQFRCQDLFHFDVPWNPARMEQRNGRIDRARQPAKEVRCHYFYYPQRAEDRVMQKLVQKVAKIQAELGSMSDVLMSQLCKSLEKQGIQDEGGSTIEAIEAIEADPHKLRALQSEFESAAAREKALERELELADRIFERSQKIMDFRPESLRKVIDMGLQLSGAEPLNKYSQNEEDAGLFTIPKLPDAWRETVDTLRSPRGRKQAFWEWRENCPPLPISFSPDLESEVEHVQLHLHHPFVKRILARFRAQGFGAHDLRRVTAIKVPGSGQVKVIVYGRLSLYGPGAVRLHDALVPIAANWLRSGAEGHLERVPAENQSGLLEKIEGWVSDRKNREVPENVQETLNECCEEDFQALWPRVQEEADAMAKDADDQLKARAQEESRALKKILSDQMKYIDRQIQEVAQDELWSAAREPPGSKSDLEALSKAQQKEQRQRSREFKAWNERKTAIAAELETEPEALAKLYEVSLRRLVPVGMLYLWPAGRC